MKVHHKLSHGESLALVELVCKHCSVTFPEYQSRLDDEESRGQFCSTECYEAHHRPEVECTWCDETFRADLNRVEEHESVFCSGECEKEWRKVQFSGDTHPQSKENYSWKRDDGTTRYVSGWDDIRQDALARDNYECQSCGVSNEEYVARHGVGLDVHHITPLSEFDDPLPDEANDLENLVSLCRSCHRMEEANE